VRAGANANDIAPRDAGPHPRPSPGGRGEKIAALIAGRLATSLRIGLSPSTLCVVRSRGWLHASRDVLADRMLGAATPDQALLGLRGVLDDAGLAGQPATVVLGNDWGRLFMVVPPRNAESRRDCEAAAHLRFQQLYGEPPQDWTVRADWNARRPFLACAMPTELLDGLRRACADHRLGLLAVRPQFVAAWNRWGRTLREGDWFGTVDAHALTLGLVERGSLTEVRRLLLTDSARADTAWPATQCTREALRQAVPAPQRLCLCGPVPPVWLAGEHCVQLDGTGSAAGPGNVIGQPSPGTALALTGARA